ncbi:MAG TPA: CopG family transcriptional regulator [Deltaproteobacteria bacterium]|nr:CopG family transcriptional regulator [Deltaproteobacteria bacterium]
MKKQEIVSFKVDEKLFQIIKSLPNRSEFIRCAIIQAMGSMCPLCDGTGILNPEQKQHWDNFAANHSVEICEECNEQYLVCNRNAEVLMEDQI